MQCCSLDRIARGKRPLPRPRLLLSVPLTLSLPLLHADSPTPRLGDRQRCQRCLSAPVPPSKHAPTTPRYTQTDISLSLSLFSSLSGYLALYTCLSLYVDDFNLFLSSRLSVSSCGALLLARRWAGGLSDCGRLKGWGGVPANGLRRRLREEEEEETSLSGLSMRVLSEKEESKLSLVECLEPSVRLSSGDGER